MNMDRNVGQPPLAVPPTLGNDPHAGSAPTGMTSAEREARSRMGRYLRRSVFPADQRQLLAEAEENGAPDEIVEALRRVPQERTYGTVAEVWAALMHTSEDEIEQRF
jgi:hypothetical protein